MAAVSKIVATQSFQPQPSPICQLYGFVAYRGAISLSLGKTLLTTGKTLYLVIVGL